MKFKKYRRQNQKQQQTNTKMAYSTKYLQNLNTNITYKIMDRKQTHS